MTSVEEALLAALNASDAVATAASGGIFIVGGRDIVDYPHLTIRRIVTTGAAHLDGPATLEWPLFQIDAWAETALAALQLGEAVRAAIDNVPASGADKDFLATLQDQRGPEPDPEVRVFKVSQDYLIFHERI